MKKTLNFRNLLPMPRGKDSMKDDRKKRMLITGVSGLLGNNLAFCLKDTYDILGLYHTYRVEIDGIRTGSVDLTSKDGLGEFIEEFQPDIIVHCAAQADVDACEKEPREAERMNVLGTQNLLRNLNGQMTKVIFISTDLVYD